MVEVETGISDDTHIVIISGVGPDDTVIIGPFRAVSRTLEPNTLVNERSERGPGGPPTRS
jgi:HlyD family secretion protein